MLMEIDEIMVPAELWRHAKAGNSHSLDRLRKYVDSLELYMHNMTDYPESIVVTLMHVGGKDNSPHHHHHKHTKMTHAPRRYVPARMTRERAILKGLEHAGRCTLLPPGKDALAALYDELILGEDHVRDCDTCRIFIALVREGFEGAFGR